MMSISPWYFFWCFWISIWRVLGEETRKVSVTEVEFQSGIDDIVWLRGDHSVVLVRTSDGHIFRSTDHGRSFTDVSNDLFGNVSRLVGIDKSPGNPMMVACYNHQSEYVISTDAATTWHPIQLPDETLVTSLSMNPSTSGNIYPSYILATSWSKDCHSSNGPDCHKILWESQDLGRNWKRIKIFVHTYKWSPDGKTVLYTYQADQTRRQIKSGSWHPGYNFAEYNIDAQKNTAHLDGGNKFIVQAGFIFVAVASHYNDAVQLYVSKDAGPFHPAKFPFDGGLKEKAYTILDANERSVTIHVQHDKPQDDGQKTGNIYISDEDGLQYTLSLPNNVRAESGEAEFDRIHGIDGVYIANHIDTTEVYMPNAHSEDDDEDDENEDEIQSLDRVKHLAREPVNTVVSFNKGASWHLLRAPAVDSRGSRLNCELKNGCSLHLHGISRYHTFAPFYSVDSAVGIVMGTGNLGSQLSYDVNDVNTYVSRDGGASWNESHKGNFIYEFGDSGGLLVMADDSRKTNMVIFSWNEGETWYDFELGERAITVENIVIEPTSSHTEFLIYGLDGSNGILYHLDFKNLDLPMCKGANSPDSVSSDYHTWVPSASLYHSQATSCLMGKSMTYVRRKRSVQCFNGMNFSRPKASVPCMCVMEDYMCSMGFWRSVDGTSCEADPSGYSSPDCRQAKVMYVPPYKRIPGNECEGGWKPSTVPVLCTVRSGMQGSSQFTLFGLTMLILLFSGVAYLGANPEIRDKYIGEVTNYVVIQTASAKESVDNWTGEVQVEERPNNSNNEEREQVQMQRRSLHQTFGRERI